MTYPVCGTDFGAHSFHKLPTDSMVLSKYGLGIALYFKFLVRAFCMLLGIDLDVYRKSWPGSSRHVHSERAGDGHLCHRRQQ